MAAAESLLDLACRMTDVLLLVPASDTAALEERIRDLRTLARSHGVGVIAVDDPSDFATWIE